VPGLPALSAAQTSALQTEKDNLENSLDALRSTTNPLQVRIGGASAEVPFSGLSPQFTGVYQVNVVVPPGATGAAVPVQLLIGGVTSADTLTVALQ